VYGKDTRESGPALVEALTDALVVVKATTYDYGLVTTPQLHYMVRCLNTKDSKKPYGEPTMEGYYNKISAAYKELIKGKASPGNVTVDCANGVGAPALRDLAKALGSGFKVIIANDDIETFSHLNESVCNSEKTKSDRLTIPVWS